MTGANSNDSLIGKLETALRNSQKAIEELREQGSPCAFWDDIEAANMAILLAMGGDKSVSSSATGCKPVSFESAGASPALPTNPSEISDNNKDLTEAEMDAVEEDWVACRKEWAKGGVKLSDADANAFASGWIACRDRHIKPVLSDDAKRLKTAIGGLRSIAYGEAHTWPNCSSREVAKQALLDCGGEKNVEAVSTARPLMGSGNEPRCAADDSHALSQQPDDSPNTRKFYPAASRAYDKWVKTAGDNPIIMADASFETYLAGWQAHERANKRESGEQWKQKSFEEIERVKACEHIADGDGDWEKLRNICPSTMAVAALRDEVERLEKLVYVPGLWKCAKCSCQTISHYLHAESGKVAANNDPQQCPNDCGPMWRVTERDAANEMIKRAEIEQCKKGLHVFVTSDSYVSCETCGMAEHDVTNQIEGGES